MGPNFEDPVLVSPDTIRVKGAFDTHGSVIGTVMIGFLIIPEHIPEALTDPIVGIAELPNDDLETTSCDAADPGARITSGPFSKDVPNNQYNLGVDAKVRVIGLSVAVKLADLDPGQSQDPPAFETFTWCVNRKVKAP
jgi:hypothetical protein